jgi:hypothetical protein
VLLRAVSKGKARDLGQRFTLVIGDHVPVNVHRRSDDRRSDVGVTHQLQLDGKTRPTLSNSER